VGLLFIDCQIWRLTLPIIHSARLNKLREHSQWQADSHLSQNHTTGSSPSHSMFLDNSLTTLQCCVSGHRVNTVLSVRLRRRSVRICMHLLSTPQAKLLRTWRKRQIMSTNCSPQCMRSLSAKIWVLWDVTSCRLVSVYQSTRRMSHNSRIFMTTARRISNFARLWCCGGWLSASSDACWGGTGRHTNCEARRTHTNCECLLSTIPDTTAT
jgi:hypothetical protein